MNSFACFGSSLVKGTIDPNSILAINRNATALTLDSSGTVIGNNLSAIAGYSSTAWGINPTNGNTTFLSLKQNSNNLTTPTSNFTFYIKHAERFYTDSIFGHGYTITSSASSVTSGNSFTVFFYSLYPTISLPYTITGATTEDLNGASILGTFTSNYQQIVFNTSVSMASKTFSMLVGTITLNIIVANPVIATNVDVSRPDTGTNLGGPWSNEYSLVCTKIISGSFFYSGTYIVKASSRAINTPEYFSPHFIFYNTTSNTTNSWNSALNRYHSSGNHNGTGLYIGTTTTTFSSTTISGEWIQIQLPYKLQLKTFSFVPRDNYHRGLPFFFYVLGSNDDNTWTAVHIQTTDPDYTSTYGTAEGVYNNVQKSFTASQSTTYYNIFRLVATRISANSWDSSVRMNQWNLFGDVYQ